MGEFLRVFRVTYGDSGFSCLLAAYDFSHAAKIFDEIESLDAKRIELIGPLVNDNQLQYKGAALGEGQQKGQKDG